MVDEEQGGYMSELKHSDKNCESFHDKLVALVEEWDEQPSGEALLAGKTAVLDFLHMPEVDALLACADSSEAPCGHDERYCYTEDGGKNIVCLLCERLTPSSTALTGNDAFVLREIAECIALAEGQKSFLRRLASIAPSATGAATFGPCSLEVRRHLEGKTGTDFIVGWNALCESVEPRRDIPAELFDGVGVYAALGIESDVRPHQVSAVLDAVVKMIRKNQRERSDIQREGKP